MKIIYYCLLLLLNMKSNFLFSQELKPLAVPALAKNHIGFVIETSVGGANVKLSMAVFLPKDYQEKTTKKYPSIIFLHGAGESGVDLERIFVHGPSAELVKNPKMMEEFPFIVLSPQTTTTSWNKPTLEALRVMVLKVLKTYRVDTNKIAVTGLSMGGLGTWEALENLSDFVGIAVPISAREWGSPDDLAKKLFYHSVWGIAGQDDAQPFVDGSKKMYKSLRFQNVTAQLTVVPGAGHGVWAQYYNNQEFYEWLLHQQKPNPKTLSQAESFRRLIKANNSLFDAAVFLLKPDRENFAGLQQGWRAEWFKDTELKASLITRVERRVNYLNSNFGLPKNVSTNLSARFTAWVNAPRRGNYSFITEADDGVRVYVNREKIIDDWRTVSNIVSKQGSVYLDKGLYKITVEYFQSAGNAGISVFWSGDNFPKRPLTEVMCEPVK